MLIDVSGIGIEIVGASTALEHELRREWHEFVASVAPSTVLTAAIRYGGEAPEEFDFDPRGMSSELSAESARFTMGGGRVDVSARTGARFVLDSGLGIAEFYVWANLLHAALAWWLPGVRGAMLHAAGMVLDGSAHLLVGSEGAGKSTWSRLAREGGASVLSDDIIVVHWSAEGAIDVLGTPFRSKDWEAMRPGRWPLARILFPRHTGDGEAAALSNVSPLITRARLAANLPFVQRAIDRDDRLVAVVERLAGGAHSMELAFGLDTSFLELLR